MMGNRVESRLSESRPIGTIGLVPNMDMQMPNIARPKTWLIKWHKSAPNVPVLVPETRYPSTKHDCPSAKRDIPIAHGVVRVSGMACLM